MVDNLAFLDRRLALCITLPLVIVTSTTCWRWTSPAHRLHDEVVHALESEGLANNLKSLADRLRQSEDRTKAASWNSLTRSIRQLPGQMQPILGRNRTIVPLPGVEWELEVAARSFADKHAPLLEELCELNKDRKAISLVPDDNDLNQWLESASDNLLASAGLDLLGCVSIQDNDEAGTLRAIQNFYGCRQTLKSVPPAIGALVRFDLSQRALFLLKMALLRRLFGRESLESIRALLTEHVEVDSGWLAMIEFELAMHLDLMSGQTQLVKFPSDTASPVARKLVTCVFPSASIMDRVRFLKLIQQLADVPTDNLAAFQSAQLRCDDLFAELQLASTRFNFNQTGFANSDNLADSFVADAMRHRLALAAVEVQLYHCEHGHYPASLDEVPTVVGNEALQPLGGRPIGYLQVDPSATIWIGSSSPWTTPVSPNSGAQYVDLTVVWTLESPKSK